MLKDLFKTTIQKDYPAIEEDRLFQAFLGAIDDDTLQWVGIIIAGSDDMHWWYKGIPLSDLAGWTMVYRDQHKNATGYVYRNGKITSYSVVDFFTRVWSLR